MPIKKNRPNLKRFTFPPHEEIERIIKRAKKSDRWTNIGLAYNATPLDKAKYKLCKDILNYEQDNGLTTKDIAQQLGLTIYRAEYILYSHIDKLTLDELITYANLLHIPRQLRINIPYAQKEIASKAH